MTQDRADKSQRRFYYSPYFCMAVVITSYALKVATKLYFGYSAGSISMRADAFHNLSDIVEAALVTFAIWLSNRKADKAYPLGRSSVEHIATFLIGAALLVLAFSFFTRSVVGLLLTFDLFPVGLSWLAELVDARLQGLDTGNVPAALGVAGTSIVVSLAVAKYQLWLGRTDGHPSLVSDGKETLSDSLTELCVFLGLLLGLFGYGWLDFAAGLAVSVIIFRTAGELVTESGRALMHSSVEPEEREALEATIRSFAGVQSLDNLVAYRVGKMVFIEAEVCVSVSDPTYLERALRRRMKQEHPDLGRFFLQATTARHRFQGRLAILLDGQAVSMDEAVIGTELGPETSFMLLQLDGDKVLTQRMLRANGESAATVFARLTEAGVKQVVTGGDPASLHAELGDIEVVQTSALTVVQWLKQRI